MKESDYKLYVLLAEVFGDTDKVSSRIIQTCEEKLVVVREEQRKLTEQAAVVARQQADLVEKEKDLAARIKDFQAAADRLKNDQSSLAMSKIAYLEDRKKLEIEKEKLAADKEANIVEQKELDERGQKLATREAALAIAEDTHKKNVEELKKFLQPKE